MNKFRFSLIALLCVFLTSQIVLGAQRGRPVLNQARTTFVADNGELLRGPFTSSEWGDPAPYAEIANMKNLGFNAVHLYAECFDINYPNPGSTAPGYSASRIDSVVNATRDLGMYLVFTIGNGANNGNYNLQYVTDFWDFYAPRYANETHVVYEIHNEPVAWGPPYSSPTATPTGALDMNIAVYNLIRQHAPNTPVLLFSYSVLGGTGGADSALTDIRAFNQSVFGTQNATWNNIAVGFHGYAGAPAAAEAVQGLIDAGYPCVMTEFCTGTWGDTGGGLDVEGVANWERMNVSWHTFQFIPPWGVADDVTDPAAYSDRVNKSGLSWTPDYGNWPVARGVYGNNGLPWAVPGYTNNVLTGTLRIEAENFDNGGKGVAYYNGNTSNPGGQYRTNETVGIENTADTGGGYNVGWIATGDWLEYTINVPTPGTYNLSLRVAGTSSGSVRVLGDGATVDLTGEWVLPNTGNWQTWTTVTKSVFLTPGQQRLRVSVLAGGFNLNWIEISPEATGPIEDGTYIFENAGSGQVLNVNSNNTVVTSTIAERWDIEHIGGGQYKVTLASNGEAWNNWSGPLYLTWWWGAGNNQCFIISPTGGDNYSIMPVGSGRYLEPSTSNPPTLAETVWSGSANQQWLITPAAVGGDPVPTDTWFYLTPGHATTKCLEVANDGTANGSNVQIMSNYEEQAQQWRFEDAGDGFYRITPRHATGKCLDVSGVALDNGANIQIWDYLSGSNQQWAFFDQGNGYYSIVARHSGLCVDVAGVSTADGANVNQWQYLGGTNQQWALAPVQTGPSDGTYAIVARHSGKSLDAYNLGTANGTLLIQWPYWGNTNQQWVVTNEGDNEYSIIGVHSGKCIDIDNWAASNGATVQLWEYLGGTNQKFFITETDSGYYRISPTHAPDYCLEVEDGLTSDGAYIQLWSYLGYTNQQWEFQLP